MGNGQAETGQNLGKTKQPRADRRRELMRIPVNGKIATVHNDRVCSPKWMKITSVSIDEQEEGPWS